MKKSSLYSASLALAIVLTIIGAVFRIQHLSKANFLFSLGMILGIPFIYFGIKDVFDNNKNEPLVKVMWTIGFIFLSVITGLVYHHQFRKRNN